MKYFANLPKILYDLSGKKPAVPVVVTNILARAHLIKMIIDNSLVYYTYDVKDSDTPEIIAEKYYNDPGLHWLVLYANNIIDPTYDWCLNYDDFVAFLINKYGDIPTAQSTIDHYTKTISKLDSASGDTFTQTYVIDQTTYNSLPDSLIETVNLSNGSTVHITTTRGIVMAYDAEVAANEAKRTIKLIDKQYVGEIVKELKTLMAVP
jgi:hypothetical protein